MIERIIFIVVGDFSLRDYQRYGIEILQSNGFKVEVWDLTNILHTKLSRDINNPETFKYSELKQFSNEKEMISQLSVLTPADFIINMLSYDPWSIITYQASSRSGAAYGVCCANSLPVPEDMKSHSYFFRRLINLIKDKESELWKRIFMRLPFRNKNIKPAKIVFSGGSKSFFNQYPVDDKTEFLQIHAYDYDLYLSERDIPSAIEPIAVFLDDQLTLSPEFTMYSERPALNTERYFNLLNDMFDYVEKKLGIKVVVAAHPRSHYEGSPNYFHGRTCIKGQTVKLVKQSRIVLAHYSTSINFANLFYKPVIFMSCSEIRNTPDDYWIKEIAKWHGKRPVSMDKLEGIDFDIEIQTNREEYDKYRKSYIKAENSEELPFWEIVSRRLKKEFNNN